MATWITDLRHVPSADAPQGRGLAAKRARLTREVVEAAMSRREAAPWRSAVRCIRAVGRRACGARVHVGHVVARHVVWSCPACGDHGDITGFEGSEHDMSAHVLGRKKVRVWAIDAHSRVAGSGVPRQPGG